ncbi:hypothetical protein WA158_004473 [Blastocystis sp. Blastoise]
MRRSVNRYTYDSVSRSFSADSESTRITIVDDQTYELQTEDNQHKIVRMEVDNALHYLYSEEHPKRVMKSRNSMESFDCDSCSYSTTSSSISKSISKDRSRYSKESIDFQGRSKSQSLSNNEDSQEKEIHEEPFRNILYEKEWRKATSDTEYMPYFGDQMLFNDPDFGILLYPERKNPKVIISVTIFNETYTELNDSLRGIADNIENLPEYSYGLTADDIIVIVIFDGREKVHPSIFERRIDDKHYLTEEDFQLMDDALSQSKRLETAWEHYKPILQKQYTDREIINMTKKLPTVQMHISGSVGNESFYSPFDILFAIKEHNRGKLSSHFWILRVFCRQLDPDYVTLLDVGTKPMKTSLIQLFNEMDENPQIGGCCGEITASDAPKTSPVMAAQFFEYKVSHFLEKAMESVFGYVSVLPGAFSAYRYEALQGTPLDKYFLLEDEQNRLSVDPFSANMYLAEDRIMGFEMLVKKDRAYTLHFISTALATTDIPSTLNILIRQRRRWLNGSFFASLYAIKEWPRLYTESGHSFFRKILLSCQLFYFVINTGMTVMQMANVFLTFAVVIQSSFQNFSELAVFILDSIYLCVTGLQFVYALGNDPRDNREVYRLSYIVYGCLSLLSLVLTFTSIENFSLYILISAATSIFVILFGAIIHGELFTILPCIIQYMFMLPTFMNIFIIYSFCNVDDVSWGTRDSSLIQNSQQIKDVEIKYKQFRSKIVLFWAALNWIYVGYIMVFEDYDLYSSLLMMIITVLFSYRLVGSILYQLIRLYKWYKKYHSKSNRSKLFIRPIDDPNQESLRKYDDTEEKKRLLVELAKVMPEHDHYIPIYMNMIETIDIDIIYDFIFHTYATWIVHNDTPSVSTNNSELTLSFDDSMENSISRECVSAEIIQEKKEHSKSIEDIVMYLGRSDFERLVIELCYLKNKSRCSTLANRMFDRNAREVSVSKTISGPRSSLLMLNYMQFMNSFCEIIRMEYIYPKNMNSKLIMKKFIQENLSYSPPLLSLFKEFSEAWKTYNH